MDRIFVFGSNTAGFHGRGAALFAIQERGAIRGIGEGLVGQSYALPTCEYIRLNPPNSYPYKITSLPLSTIQTHVDKFIGFAKAHPELTFQLTPVGTGLAGFTHDQIAPMFKGIPKNVDVPEEWIKYDLQSV